jgi:hypothetical protein
MCPLLQKKLGFSAFLGFSTTGCGAGLYFIGFLGVSTFRGFSGSYS